MINLKSIPFFKILFPYIIGICLVFQFGTFKQQHWCLLIVTALLAVSFFIQKSLPANYFKKANYIVLVNLFLILSAFESAYIYDERNNDNHYSHFVNQSNQAFIAEIVDVPVETKKNIKLLVNIKQIEFNNSWHSVNGKTIIYVKRDTVAKIKPFDLGDAVFVQSKFSYVNEPQNPNEFDYKQYLKQKNIYHIVFAKTTQLYHVNQSSDGFNFTDLGTSIKAKTISILRESGLSQQAFSICSALLVGYDDEIDKSVMQSFSHSGTLHVLSVSGMHTGVLYGILVFMFSLFDKYDRYKKWKCFLIVFCLTLFVFITGLSPSVLRAALMLSLILIGKTFYRQGNSYNTLLLSAFILLLINPYLLVDVGFLLSYFAVFGIMYLYPILNNLYYFENKVIRWAWSLSLMSVAATVFTLPISLYYFHQFPIWFVFSNLIIIPLSTVLMVGAIALIVSYKIVVLKTILVYCIDMINELMLWFAALTDDKNLGYIDYISFTAIDLFFCTLFIATLLIVVRSRQYKQVLSLGVVSVVWLSHSIYTNYEETQQKELVVFYIKHKPCYVIRQGKTIYANMEALSEDEIQRNIKPYLVGISDFKIVSNNSDLFQSDFVSILHINQKTLTHPKTDYLIVSNNTPISLEKQENKPLIIADCSNSYTFVKKLKKQCALFNVPFYSVKEKGALQLNLN